VVLLLLLLLLLLIILLLILLKEVFWVPSLVFYQSLLYLSLECQNFHSLELDQADVEKAEKEKEKLKERVVLDVAERRIRVTDSLNIKDRFNV
jgi:hypothetical protein